MKTNVIRSKSSLFKNQNTSWFFSQIRGIHSSHRHIIGLIVERNISPSSNHLILFLYSARGPFSIAATHLIIASNTASHTIKKNTQYRLRSLYLIFSNAATHGIRGEIMGGMVGHNRPAHDRPAPRIPWAVGWVPCDGGSQPCCPRHPPSVGLVPIDEERRNRTRSKLLEEEHAVAQGAGSVSSLTRGGDPEDSKGRCRSIRWCRSNAGQDNFAVGHRGTAPPLLLRIKAVVCAANRLCHKAAPPPRPTFIPARASPSPPPPAPKQQGLRSLGAQQDERRALLRGLGKGLPSSLPLLSGCQAPTLCPSLFNRVRFSQKQSTPRVVKKGIWPRWGPRQEAAPPRPGP